LDPLHFDKALMARRFYIQSPPKQQVPYGLTPTSGGHATGTIRLFFRAFSSAAVRRDTRAVFQKGAPPCSKNF
jgi:hypothetical protein